MPILPHAPSARRAIRAFALLVVLAIVAPTIAPAAQAAGLAIDLRQRIDVITTSDEEPTYVAGVVQEFAATTGGNARVVTIDDPRAFVDAIRASNAAILIVAAHGSSDTAGPGSGLLVGGERIAEADLLDAIHASGAKRFYFAACGLGLADEIDNRPVHSFSVPIDKKLAAVEALSEIGYIYTPENQQRLVPEFRSAIADIGGIEELFLRWLMPIEPLRPDDGKGYSCYDDNSCDWDRTEEERLQEAAQREGGGLAAPAPEFSQALQWLFSSGMARIEGNGHEEYNKVWDFFFEIDFQCKILFDVMDLVIPGYSQVLDHLPDIKGVDFDFSILRVELCGQMFFGILSAGGTAGGGQMRLQVGQNKEVGFKFGFITVKFSFYIGVIIEGTALLEDASGGSMEYLRLNLQFAIYLLVEGSWGWGSGTVRFDFLNPPWQRADTFRNPFYNGPTNAAVEPRLPTLPVATNAPLLEDAVTEYVVLPLSQPALNAIRNDPELAARLSEATGTDATALLPGTLLNLGNRDVYRAIYGDENAERSAVTLLQAPIIAPALTGPVGVEGCRVIADPIAPLGGVRGDVCIEDTPEDAGVAASGGTGGNDLDGTLLGSPAGAFWGETYDAGTMRACRAVQSADSNTCHLVALATAGYSIWKSRADDGPKASIRVRLDKENAAAFIDVCADLDANNPVCVAGSAGVVDLAPGEGGSFEVIDIYASVAGPGGSVDQRAATLRSSLGFGTAIGDITCWIFAFEAPGGTLEC